MNFARRNAISKILGMSIAILVAIPTLARAEEAINKDEDSIAISGYDTVAYFSQSKAVEGSKAFSHMWQDAEWWFANAEHRDLFVKDPEKYAPRYGGFCALAMARGLKYTVDPEIWIIVDGKLYLNYSKEYGAKFAENAPDRIAKADMFWAELGSGD